MLPRHEIIAWREHANWSRDAQIEQDVLLTRAMVAIFRDPFLSEQVAMRGGTVLHKVHLAPASRYSEDIDLVLVGPRPISHVRKGLARVLQPVLGAPILDVLGTIQLAVRNAVRPSSVARTIRRSRNSTAPSCSGLTTWTRCSEQNCAPSSSERRGVTYTISITR
jgi:hypothetical protein